MASQLHSGMAAQLHSAMTTRARHIQKLSTELLGMILLKVRNSSELEEYKDVLTVCKEWNNAGKEYTFYSLSLLNNFIDEFRYEIQRNPSKLANTRALFVNLELAWPDEDEGADIIAFLIGPVVPGRPVPQHDPSEVSPTTIANRQIASVLTLLSNNMHHFTSLKTFSFIIRREYCPSAAQFPWNMLTAIYHDYECTLNRRTLKDIIAAIPSTVVNLELDTHGLDRMGIFNNDQEPHCCDALRALLPQLKHCRLRLLSLCPSFFLDTNGTTTSAKYLKTLVVNFSQSSPHMSVNDYTRSTRPCEEAAGTAAPFTHPDLDRQQLQYRRYLESKLKQSAASWEDLTKCETCFSVCAVARDRATTCHYEVNDLLADTTTIVPAHIIPATQPIQDMWVLGRSRSNALLVAPNDDYEELVEGSWCSTEREERFPSSFFEKEGDGDDAGVYARSLDLQRFHNWRADFVTGHSRPHPRVPAGAMGELAIRRMLVDAEVMTVMERPL